MTLKNGSSKKALLAILATLPLAACVPHTMVRIGSDPYDDPAPMVYRPAVVYRPAPVIVPPPVIIRPAPIVIRRPAMPPAAARPLPPRRHEAQRANERERRRNGRS